MTVILGRSKEQSNKTKKDDAKAHKINDLNLQLNQERKKVCNDKYLCTPSLTCLLNS